MIRFIRIGAFALTYFAMINASAQIDFSVNSANGGIYINRSIVPILKMTQFEGDYSPWLFDANVDGIITSPESTLTGKLNYNVETRQLKVETNGKELYFSLGGINSFKVSEKEGEVRVFEVKRSGDFSSNPTIVETIDLGNYTLFLDRFVEFKRGDYNVTLNVGEKDKYISSIDIFLQDNSSYSITKLSKKNDVFKSISTSKDLKSFWSENKLNFDVSSLVRLISFAQSDE